MKTVSTGQVFIRFTGRVWRGFLSMFFPLLSPPILQFLSPSSPLLTKCWAGHHLSISESCAWNHLAKIGAQSLVAGSLCYAQLLSHVRLGLEPGQKPRCLASGPNEAQALDALLKKKLSERHSDKYDGDLFGFREKPAQGVGHHRGERPWNVMWLVFVGWVISHTNEWEDHSNSWGTTHSSVFWQCLGRVLAPPGVSFSLQIEDQDLVESD